MNIDPCSWIKWINWINPLWLIEPVQSLQMMQPTGLVGLVRLTGQIQMVHERLRYISRHGRAQSDAVHHPFLPSPAPVADPPNPSTVTCTRGGTSQSFYRHLHPWRTLPIRRREILDLIDLYREDVRGWPLFVWRRVGEYSGLYIVVTVTELKILGKVIFLSFSDEFFQKLTKIPSKNRIKIIYFFCK